MLASCHVDALQGELAEVGNHQGFAVVNAVVCKKRRDITEDVVDGGRRAEVGDTIEDVVDGEGGIGTEFTVMGFQMRAAEGDVIVDAGHATAAAVRVGVGATGRVVKFFHRISPEDGAERDSGLNTEYHPLPLFS